MSYPLPGHVSSSLGRAMAAITVLALLSAHAGAAVATWTGAGSDTNWSTAANWAVAPPVSGDSVDFPALPSGGVYTANNDIPSLTLTSITVNGTVASYTIGGGQTLTITSLTSDGSVTFSTFLAVPTGTLLVTASSGALTFQSQVSGSGGVAYSGPGTISLTSAVSNSYTGDTTISNTIMTFNRGGGNFCVGTGALTLSSGAVLDVLTSPSFASNTVTIDSGCMLDLSAAVGVNGSGDTESIGGLDGAGTIALGASRINCSGTASASDFTGNITGTSGGLRKTIAGIQRLEGADTYAGATSLSGGELTIRGTQSASPEVLTGGTLRLANGCTVGPVTTSGGSAAALSIGNDGGTSNHVSSGDLSLASRVDVFTNAAGSGGDSLLTVSGTVTLSNPTLRIDTTGRSPAAGSVWTIIDNDGSDAISGTFAGLAEGATVASTAGPATTFTISYVGGSGNDVTLTAVSASGTGGTATAGTTTGGSTTSGSTTAATGGPTSTGSDDHKKCGFGGNGGALAAVLALAVGYRRRKGR